jgi:hypothetical protein
MRPGSNHDQKNESAIGQSEVIGLVLVFGISFLAIGIILITGLPSLDQAEELAQIERVQTEFMSLDQQIRESVYTPGQSGTSIALSDGGISVNSSSVVVNVTYYPNGGTPETTGKRQLGGLVYETSGSGVAYEMGGVWATYSDGSESMQKPPNIMYKGDSLKISMTNFTEDVRVAGTGTREFIVQSEGTNRINQPSGSLENGTLNISVKTDYEEAWTEYFEREFNTSGQADIDDTSDGYANVSLVTGGGLYNVEYLKNRFQNNNLGSNNITNYDPGIGNTSAFNYTVSGGTFTPPLASDPPVDAVQIDNIIDSASGLTPIPPSPATISTADKYEITSGSLIDYTFNTTNGSIEVYDTVSGSLNVQDIEVNGDNPVYLYTNDPDFDPPGVEAEDPENFQVFTDDGSLTISADFNGTVYAPAATPVEIDSGAQVRGAVIANQVVLDSGSNYYHDASLRRAALPSTINPPIRHFVAVERKVAVR